MRRRRPGGPLQKCGPFSLSGLGARRRRVRRFRGLEVDVAVRIEARAGIGTRLIEVTLRARTLASDLTQHDLGQLVSPVDPRPYGKGGIPFLGANEEIARAVGRRVARGAVRVDEVDG